MTRNESENLKIGDWVYFYSYFDVHNKIKIIGIVDSFALRNFGYITLYLYNSNDYNKISYERLVKLTDDEALIYKLEQ